MDKKEFGNILTKYANETKINLNEEEIDLFYTYMQELLEWNEKINLTAITDPEEIALKHFVDSLIIEKHIKGNTLIDIGTGAGFPAIPVKIHNKNLNIALLDSLNKRINFLNNVIEKLKLGKIKAVHGRAEDFGRDNEYREKFDMVTSRAVAELSILCEYMLPFVKVGGICICMKGQGQEEIENAKEKISLLGGKIIKIEKYKLPLTDMERTIIIIKKVKETPGKYPRKPNQIKQKNKNVPRWNMH